MLILEFAGQSSHTYDLSGEELGNKMYVEHYNLRDKPFQITCDPKYLWLSEKHKEALAMLRYGILDNRGFLLLTGEVGTGKTLLINQLITLLPTDTIAVTISDPDMSRAGFYQILSDGFKLPSQVRSKAAFLIQLREYLHETAAKNRSVALIIDEAHRLNHHQMEDIRTLSNIELPDKKLIDIFLVGQQELNQILLKEENRALSQRITLRYHIEPLNRNETAKYILHRLEVAGGSEDIFSEGALSNIFEYTAGVPRLINILCDHALLSGSVSGNTKLGADIIEQCAHELRIPEQQKSLSNFRSTSKPEDPDTRPATTDAPPGKEKKTQKEVRLFDDEELSLKPKTFRLLKWASVGVVVPLIIFAIAIAIALMNLNDLSFLFGDKKAETKSDQSAEVVAPAHSNDATGLQDLKNSSEEAPRKTAQGSENSDAGPGESMQNPLVLGGQANEKAPIHNSPTDQNISSSSSGADDALDSDDDAIPYNQDK